MASTTKTFRHSPYAAISPLTIENDQSGLTILIIGASSGIGLAIAEAFVQAKASRVIITGRQLERLEQVAQTLQQSSSASEVVPMVCDINAEYEINNLWQRLLLDDIFVDVLVINAAETSSGTILRVKDFLPQLRTAIQTNLFAHLLAVSSFLEQPKDQFAGKPKSIINISSFAAHANPMPLQAAYM